MAQSETGTLCGKYVIIFLVVAGYWIISISTVFVNKTLLSDLDFDAPMFIAFFQTVTTVLICLVMQIASAYFPDYLSFTRGSPFKWKTIAEVFPVSVLFTTMIVTNNLCLKFVSVAFYYIGRSLTTIFNVIFTYLILKEKTSRGCIICCLIIIFGFYMGVDQEKLAGSLSVSGTIFGVLASLALSLYSIFTKRVLPFVNEEVWLLTYYNNVYCCILMVPLMVFNGEMGEIRSILYVGPKNIWLIMLLGGFCGFAIGIFTSLQIKYTSALTHNISGTAKACAQTVIATYWYQETKPFLWWLSNGVVLAGSAGYARLKQIEMEIKHRANPNYQRV